MPWEPPEEEEFDESWITPLEALGISDPEDADETDEWAILEQLRAGQIIAVARTGQPHPDVGAVMPFVRISAGAWRHASGLEERYFWRTGHLVVPVQDAVGMHSGKKERYFNVRFDPATLSGRPPQRIPDEPQPDEQQSRPKNLKGAKRKDWWDHLWIEMIRRIRAGTLNPKNKAELQGILEDCVDEIGGNYGDSTLKRTASNLFEYLEESRGK
jgi:hypothetical protein